LHVSRLKGRQLLTDVAQGGFKVYTTQLTGTPYKTGGITFGCKDNFVITNVRRSVAGALGCIG